MALMSRIDLVSKNLLAILAKTIWRKLLSEKYRKNIANVSKIAGIRNFSKFYFYKEKRPRRASLSPQISQKSQK